MKTEGMPESYRKQVEQIVDERVELLLADFLYKQSSAQIAVIEACGYEVVRRPATSTDQERSEDKTHHATQLKKGVYTDGPPGE